MKNSLQDIASLQLKKFSSLNAVTKSYKKHKPLSHNLDLKFLMPITAQLLHKLHYIGDTHMRCRYLRDSYVNSCKHNASVSSIIQPTYLQVMLEPVKSKLE